MPQTARPPRRTDAFSLIELLLVISILAALAAIVLPRFASADDEARINAAATITRTVQGKLAEYHANHNAYPTAVDPNWFAGQALPHNPFNPNVGSAIVNQNIPGKVYLQYKTNGSKSDTYWYNRATGVFQIRVPEQGNAADNLDLYNRVNHTNATAMNQTTQ